MATQRAVVPEDWDWDAYTPDADLLEEAERDAQNSALNWCCTYRSGRERKVRSVLQLFCECDAVDETLSALVKGETPPMARIHDAMKDIADRIRIPWPGGAIKVKVGLIVVLPLLIFLLWLSTLLQSYVLAGYANSAA
eukprot:g995.t1